MTHDESTAEQALEELLKAGAEGAFGAGEDPAPADAAWDRVKRVICEDMETHGVAFCEDDEDGPWLTYGVMSENGSHILRVRVTYVRRAECVTVKVSYPFYIAQENMLFANDYVNIENFRMRFTRLTLDRRDGEINMYLTIPCISAADFAQRAAHLAVCRLAQQAGEGKGTGEMYGAPQLEELVGITISAANDRFDDLLALSYYSDKGPSEEAVSRAIQDVENAADALAPYVKGEARLDGRTGAQDAQTSQ